METQSLHRIMAYKKAKKRAKEKINYFLFVLAYIGAAVFLKYSDVPEKWFLIDPFYIDILIVLQGMVLLVYGGFLFLPFARKWEQKMINKLMKKEMEKNYSHE